MCVEEACSTTAMSAMLYKKQHSGIQQPQGFFFNALDDQPFK